MTQATIGIVKIRRPISQEVYGYRLVAVTPNKARYNMYKKKYVTSFAKKYIIDQRGDYKGIPALVEVERFIQRLKEWHMVTRAVIED